MWNIVEFFHTIKQIITIITTNTLSIYSPKSNSVKLKIYKVFARNMKTNLVLVFVMIALLCAGFFVVTNSLFFDFEKQKEQYRLSSQVLLETSNLVSHFYHLQEYGNLFFVQKDKRYLNIYQSQIDTFQQKLEQIIQFIHFKDENFEWVDFTHLLNEKKMMLKELQQMFVNKNDIELRYHKMTDSVENKIDKDLFQIMETNTVTLRDTVWQDPKSLGQRLRDAFRSTKKRGKEIAAVNTVIVSDTLITHQTIVESYLLDSLYKITQQFQNQYSTKIEKIEIELYALLTADQYITKEITTLLLQLHEDMLLNVISLGEEYEEKAQKALMRSVGIGTLALLLIAVFIIFIFRNIKTIRKTNEALAWEKQKTEDLMKSRHQLLLATSHDIKTPLSALLGYLELWENENLSSTQLQQLNIMQYTGKNILALLNNLLEYTRLEQQKTQVLKENVEIVPFFMEIMDMFQPLCNEKKNKLIYRMQVNNHPQILIDSLKLKQIIVNVVSNSVKYTTDGTINVFVDVMCNPDLQLVIKVEDTGRGIPKDKLPALFEPFTRVENNSSGIEGSGLGLFVVKGLLDLLGGKIEMETEENIGTTVSINIPCESVLEDNKLENLPTAPLVIWVIEDDSTQLQVIVSMVQKLGHTPITSVTKADFEKTAGVYREKSTAFDIVFTDLEMGDLNGYEVLQKIKSQYDVPVICLSGNVAISKAELQQTGFDDFLEKPFSLAQLEKVLLSIITQKSETKSKLFSLRTLYEMFDNDKETVLALLETFVSSLPDDIQKFERALAEQNLFLLQQTAHKILPFCKQIEAVEIVPILEKIELSKKRDQIQFKDFEEDTILLVKKMKRILQKLQVVVF